MEDVSVAFCCHSPVEQARQTEAGAGLCPSTVFQQYIDLESLPLISGNTSEQNSEPRRAPRDPDWEQISQIPIAFHLPRMMDSPPVSHQSSPAAEEVTPGPDLSSYTTSGSTANQRAAR